MATTNPSVARAYVASQDLFTITYPLADIEQISIANVSKATTAVVSTNSTLPVTFVDGTQVLVTGVGGMTQLATAGVSNSRVFFANVISSNTFGLYTVANLTGNVNSTGFSNATANTGGVSLFTVPQYNSVGNTAQVVFDESGPEYGSAISVDTTTGVISVAADLVYTFTATAEINVPGATYQWYEVTSGTPVALGSSAPVGTPVTLAWTPADPGDVALIVTAAEGTTFSYPTQIKNAQAVVQVASGFVA